MNKYSSQDTPNMLNLVPIPAFSDNYIWALIDTPTKTALIVDPGQAEPVEAFLQQHGLDLTTILVTHHHPDHTGGIEHLRKVFNCEVIGGKSSQYLGITTAVNAGSHFTRLNIEFEVLSIPGHTLDHIAYFASSPSPFVFCGDTLFAGGCGRIFEGTPPQMLESLKKLNALPASTKVYCAHEYTLSNLKFALAVEPENPALQKRQQQVEQLRQQDLPTVPSSLAIERETNPFLRTQIPAVIAAVQQQFPGSAMDEVSTFAQLRGWKDHF